MEKIAVNWNLREIEQGGMSIFLPCDMEDTVDV